MNQVPGTEMSIQDILNFLPHRYPFLLVDRVVQLEPFKSLKALKNVTINEPFFQGHFPDYPVMPGVLILESLAQAGGLLVAGSVPDQMQGKIFLFTGVDKVRFRKPVFPGDSLYMHITYDRHRMNLWRMHGQAVVQDRVAAEGMFSATIVDREDQA
ncbi:beta-hydroxyacyl-(acyl-carrier-protein) dehydratase FabZ [Desulfonatronospira thiodismutans ASO3-1]|uniref:3-hydroxyacyl-[acyl-carrier-protein] dehydratase FabZ n=2 Tax=Desulfonatronovibrionaceae TaxID=3031459 RepID=D6SPA3_9BACT|nr:beta-hydroxyacyl-(acyl-carrier-protein) dehydratase FabZ [Desulfonatronospira thiodismutans ASO3-1]